MKKEIRFCPDKHVKYEVMPFTFSNFTLNGDKRFCPVCGKRLSVRKYEVEDDFGYYMRDFTEEESKEYNESIDKMFKPTGIRYYDDILSEEDAPVKTYKKEIIVHSSDNLDKYKDRMLKRLIEDKISNDEIGEKGLDFKANYYLEDVEGRRDAVKIVLELEVQLEGG